MHTFWCHHLSLVSFFLIRPFEMFLIEGEDLCPYQLNKISFFCYCCHACMSHVVLINHDGPSFFINILFYIAIFFVHHHHSRFCTTEEFRSFSVSPFEISRRQLGLHPCRARQIPHGRLICHFLLINFLPCS